MNCDEALSLLYEMIDKEASEVDTEEVKKHLKKCDKCKGIYELEGVLNEFIVERVRNGSAVSAHEKLRMKIRLRLDEIDDEVDSVEQPQSGRRTPRPFRLPAVALAAAAALIILIGAGYYGTRIYTHQRLFVPLEQAHWADESETTPPLSDSELTLALGQASDLYHYQLRPTIGGYRFVNGHSEELMGQSMMHYTYVNNDSKVSVFLAPAEFFSRYEDTDLQEVVRDSLTLFDHHCSGCRLVFHRVGQVLVITASTDREVELLDFIPGHTAI